MKPVDYFIQKWRMRIVARWLPNQARILDIGCHQGEFLLWLGKRISPSIGYDPLYKGTANMGDNKFVSDKFQEGLPFEDGSFDAVTLLATIEHIHDKSVISREAARLLRSGGRIIITVPSPFVDKILNLLVRLHIVDGMSLEEHHGFLPHQLSDIFIPDGFELRKKQKFQFGLNNLYVFERV